MRLEHVSNISTRGRLRSLALVRGAKWCRVASCITGRVGRIRCVHARFTSPRCDNRHGDNKRYQECPSSVPHALGIIHWYFVRARRSDEAALTQ